MIYVVRSNDGRFYRRGKLVQSRMAASCGHSPSGVKGILTRARAAFPELQWEAVPFRENPPMPKTTREKQEDYRARMALLGMKEVRGIYLPEALHPVIKEQAAKLLEQHSRKDK